MKAIVQDRYGTTDVLEFSEIDRPVARPGEVLVRVHAAGIDPGIWHLMTGMAYLIRLLGFGLRTPKTRIRGLDFAGVVEAVGENVTRVQPGDEVFGTCKGAFAEYAIAEEDKIALKPPNLTFDEAAAVATSGFTALQALRDAGRVKPGQHILIIGASGGVGTYAVQLAKMFGARVTGVCSTVKTDLVRSIGADEVIDYTREDCVDGTRRYDLILDAAGNRPLNHLRRALNRNGTLVIVGGEGGGKWLGGMERVLRATLLTPFVSQRLRGLISAERPSDLRFLREAIEAGEVTPIIDRTYSLAEVPDAITYVHKGRATGKVVVTM